ncbi:MAG: hypothetical protein HDT28_03045 [Clostridiales bacterium]|nr:hypothetical protein [Clostridiales bacterium]
MAKKDKTKPEAAAPAADKKGKEKKDKKNKKGAAPDAAASGATSQGGTTVNGVQTTTTTTTEMTLANMSPEQMTAAQIEQAIKESNDPNNRLKKLRNPINVRSCLLNVLILIVATLAVVILWCFLVVDKFNFVTVMSDMMYKFGITQFFTNMGTTISGWFS